MMALSRPPSQSADDNNRLPTSAPAPAPAPSTAVAIDRDKHSHQAVRWAVDHLLRNNQTIVLIHVKCKNVHHHGFAIVESTSEANREQIESEVQHMFVPFRGFCARKGVQMKEVVLEDIDVSKAIINYITANHIHNIVVGSSNRSVIAKKFRNSDVPTSLIKSVPEFCAVYVIYKGKPVTVKSAKGHAPANHTPSHSKQPSSPATLHHHSDQDDSIKTPCTRANYRGSLPPPGPSTVPERSFENFDYMKTPMRPLSGSRTPNVHMLHEFTESSHRPLRPTSSSRDSIEDMDLHGTMRFQSMDLGDTFELSSNLSDSPRGSYSPNSNSIQRDLEAEMRRLRLELKQTMDMYSNACKEAISAKQKAKELHQWKMEEARKFEEARHAEEAALALVEMEKAKAKAALEEAEAAQRIAKLEAQKRLYAEMKAKREAEERLKALDAVVHHDIRYRKYSIEEIEIATDSFSEDLKIGEGGYGPVYKASLDHTPVAIKVLRPDAAQGRRQFQQELEVLSCIRHPNMVLLLGACPEYGCLVYEYMDNGSLDDRLFRRGNTPSIPWSVRFKIAAEIATGLLFLHQAKPEPLVHRDLKPANILLDRNYVSKISDVGLARLVPPSVADSVTQYRMTSAAGTFCYIDPEYQQTGMLGIKSDVYSLGVMLLQIITARPPMGLSHHVEKSIERGTFEEMLDPTVPDWPVEEALGFAKLALKCVELRKKDRPDLGTVILPELNRLRNLGHAFEASYGSAGGATPGKHSGGPQERAVSMVNQVTGSPSVGTPSWRSTDTV